RRAAHRAAALALVRRPLPDVADHVERADRRRPVGKRSDRRGADVAVVVEQRVLPAREPLARGLVGDVGELDVDRVLVAPRVATPVGAARDALPLGLGRQPLAGPLAVSRRLAPVDAVDRMLLAALLLPVAELGELLVLLAVHERHGEPLRRATLRRDAL